MAGTRLMERTGESVGHCQGHHGAHPWCAGPAWPRHSAPLGEELCAEIAVGKPPPPFPELKICQGCVCREIFINQEPWQAGLAREKSHVPWAWGHPWQPCSWSRVQVLVRDAVWNVLTVKNPDVGSPMERDGEKPERNQGLLPSTWWMRPRGMGWSWALQSSPRPRSRRTESNPV